MSDHYHHASEIQGAADGRHGHPDLERDIAGVESDLRNHRHYDLECEDERLKGLLDQWGADLRQLREDLAAALDRIRVLEEQTPEAGQAEYEADVALADAAGSGHDESWRNTLAGYHVASGGANYDDEGAGEDRQPGCTAPRQDSEPFAAVPRLRRVRPPADVIDEDTDDEGGMSEYRYVLPEDYERGQS